MMVDYYMENFNAYTEVDPNNHITISSSVSITHESYRNEWAYLYDDKGVDYFGTEFTHYLEITPVTYTDIFLPIAKCWMLSNDNSPDVAKPYLRLGWYEQGGLPKLELEETRTGGTVFYHSIALSWGTKYYITIVRDATTLKCHIYSDSSRSVLVETMTINLVLTSQKYRYIYACYIYLWIPADLFEHKVERLMLGGLYAGGGGGGEMYNPDTGEAFEFEHILEWEELVRKPMPEKPVYGRDIPTPEAESYQVLPSVIVISVRMNTSEKESFWTLYREHVWLELWDDLAKIDDVWMEEPRFRWDSSLGCGGRPWICTVTFICKTT